tara:strand:- start:202 stop:1218 length:1017 start_codon:yes stop_codon:yes gene_type:complete
MNHRIKKKKIVSYLTLFIFCIAIVSCDIKRDAIGANDDLVVLAAKEDRDDIRSLLSIVFNDTLLTPEPEPFYNVKFADPDSYDALKTQTNLIIASIGDYELNPATKLVRELLGKKAFESTLENNPIILSRDQFAKNQLFMIMSGEKTGDIKEYLIRNGSTIKDEFDQNFDKKQSQYFLTSKRQEDLEEQLLSDYKWTINLPWGWEMIRNNPDSNFVWIGQEMPFRWIAVQWRNGNYFSEEEALDLANTFPQKYFKSQQYNKEFLSIDFVDYREDAAYRLSGLWESIDEAKGGPFVGYLFYDYESDRTFYVTYLIFNPGGKKAFYMKQMELFSKTLTIK